MKQLLNICHYLTIFILLLGICNKGNAQSDTRAKEIIEFSDNKLRGLSSFAEISMKVVRPDWTREMKMKSWSKGTELALILINYPARDKGVAFLKRSKELWNWQPTINRAIKMPPSMMLQSWMGSDFTNDDLVKQSSLVIDYVHRIVGKETIEKHTCYIIELIPLEDAPVVWGKVLMWVDEKDYMQLKVEFYDEDNFLINTMFGRSVQNFDGKLLPSILEIVPEEDHGHKTIIEYLSLDFDIEIKDSFFSIQNMKRVR